MGRVEGAGRNPLTPMLALRKSSHKSYSALHRGSWPQLWGADREKLGGDKGIEEVSVWFLVFCLQASEDFKQVPKCLY